RRQAARKRALGDAERLRDGLPRATFEVAGDDEVAVLPREPLQLLVEHLAEIRVGVGGNGLRRLGQVVRRPLALNSPQGRAARVGARRPATRAAVVVIV